VQLHEESVQGVVCFADKLVQRVAGKKANFLHPFPESVKVTHGRLKSLVEQCGLSACHRATVHARLLVSGLVVLMYMSVQ